LGLGMIATSDMGALNELPKQVIRLGTDNTTQEIQKLAAEPSSQNQ
jgi:hypothetical protein